MQVSDFEKVIEINVGRHLGVVSKVALMEVARHLPIYNQPFDSDITGVASDGQTVKVTTLGRYVFGIPGYEGILRFYPEDNKVFIFYPTNASKEVEDLLNSLKETFEKNL